MTWEIYLDTGTEWVLAAASSAVLDAHLTDFVKHITAVERESWKGKISPSTLTTLGDILYHNGAGLVRLSRGLTGQVLTVNSNGTLGWGDANMSVIKSIQWGVVENVVAGNTAITINAVNMNKSIVLFSGDGITTISYSNAGTRFSFKGHLTKTTTLIIVPRAISTGGSSQGAWNVVGTNNHGLSLSWQVVEFN